MQKSLSTIIESLKTGNAGRPTFSPVLVEWFQQGWLLGSLEFGLAEIRSGILLQALLPPDLRVFREAFVFVAVTLVLLFRPKGLIPAPGLKERI